MFFCFTFGLSNWLLTFFHSTSLVFITHRRSGQLALRMTRIVHTLFAVPAPDKPFVML